MATDNGMPCFSSLLSQGIRISVIYCTPQHQPETCYHFHMSHLSIDIWSKMPFIFNGLWPLISPLAFTSLLLIWQCRRIRILQWHGRPAHIGLLFCKYFTTIHVVLHLFAISIFKRCFLTDHCLILSAISFYTGKVVTRTFLYDERGVRYVSFFYPSLKYKQLSHQVGVLNRLMMFPFNWKIRAYFQYLITPPPMK